MPLFSRLLNLNTGNIPLENFFTEIVAYLFRENKEILYNWLEYSNLLDTSTCLDAYISTQRSFDALDVHFAGSRPDIVIELVYETHRDIIFIESKIGSQEGKDQLLKYADILHNFSDFRSKILIYITRDFEPKNESNILKEISNNTVRFKQLRWYQFHRFLESHLDKYLVQETVEFMEEYNMAHNNQFSSVDVLALTNFTKSLRIMEQTMSGKVIQRFEEVVGVKPKKSRFGQLQYHERYFMMANMSSEKWEKWAWWCGLGFYLKTSNITEYPTVRLMLEVAPNFGYRTQIIHAMNDISSQSGWRGYHLNEQQAWSNIVLEKSLRDFLSQEDHVTAIEKFFLEALNELAEIKRKYPQLPWVVISENQEPLEAPLLTAPNELNEDEDL
jgi:hypothetical protein